MKFLIVFVVIFIISQQTKAASLDNHINDESMQKSSESGALKKCKERICSRIYRPLCVSVDGIQATLSSRCHLTKLRCDALKHSLQNTKDPRPIIRVVHIGGCYEKPKRRQNSKWLQNPEDVKYKGRY